MENTEILITSKQIQEKIKELASQIARDYPDGNLVLIGILDGVYILMADLTRELFSLGLKNIEVAFFVTFVSLNICMISNSYY